MLSFAKVLAALKLLCGIKSRVSKDRDYILSVWVDLDTYKISLHFQGLSVEELLEDALLQLHREYRVFVSSRYPAGLTESDLRTACWFVNYSGNEQKIEESTDLFAKFNRHDWTFNSDVSRLPSLEGRS